MAVTITSLNTRRWVNTRLNALTSKLTPVFDAIHLVLFGLTCFIKRRLFDTLNNLSLVTKDYRDQTPIHIYIISHIFDMCKYFNIIMVFIDGMGIRGKAPFFAFCVCKMRKKASNASF